LHFAPDAEDALEFAVALGNTDPSASPFVDELSTPAALTALLEAHSYSGRFDRDARELAEVAATRSLVRRAWSLDRDSLAREVNQWLSSASASPFLVRHDDFDWHLHATPPDAPLAVRMRVEIALALADVVRSDLTSRMRVCAAPDCTGLLLDLSRNGSKRFCSVRCGNRVNQVAYRERAS
jgi:predicted RNA-binding Zn ribbon-like protein